MEEYDNIIFVDDLPDQTYDLRISDAGFDREVLVGSCEQNGSSETDISLLSDSPVSPCLLWVIGTIISGKYRGKTVQAPFPQPHMDLMVRKWLLAKTGKTIGEVAQEKDMELDELVGEKCRLIVRHLSDKTLELEIE